MNKNKFDGTELGTFEVESGKLMITDPCYEPGTWCQGELREVHNGTWSARVIKNGEGRCAELVAECDVVSLSEASRFWEPQDIDVGVDSGQAGIFDSEHFRSEADAIGIEKSWYSMCCDKTLGKMGAGVIPCGVVSSSGYGDGSYNCFIRKRKDKIVAVKIIFISEEDEED